MRECACRLNALSARIAADRWLLALLALAFMAAACGPKEQQPGRLPEPPKSTTTPPPPPAEPVEEASGAGAEELETIPPPPPVSPMAEGWSEESPPPAPEPAARTTFGYRVQVFAGAARDGAEAVAAEARGKLGEAVAIEYQAPFYKVRIGNCVTRHEAERLRERVTEAGYEGAFIVETTIELE